MYSAFELEITIGSISTYVHRLGRIWWFVLIIRHIRKFKTLTLAVHRVHIHQIFCQVRSLLSSRCRTDLENQKHWRHDQLTDYRFCHQMTDLNDCISFVMKRARKRIWIMFPLFLNIAKIVNGLLLEWLNFFFEILQLLIFLGREPNNVTEDKNKHLYHPIGFRYLQPDQSISNWI